LLAETMKEHPQASEKTIHDHLWKKIEDIQSYYLTLFDNWFANNYPHMEVVQQGPNDVVARRKIQPRHTAAQKAAQKTKAIQRLANFVYMNQVLSTRKFMSDSSSHDVKREGGYFGAVAKAAGKHGALALVGKHLEEKDLKNIRSRYFKEA